MISTMTLLTSETEITTVGSTTPTASITTVQGRLYIFAVADSTAITSVTGPGVGFSWQKLQTVGTNDFIELFGGVCTAGGSGNCTITVAAGVSLTYAIIEVEGNVLTTPFIQKTSAAAATTTLAAATGVQPATLLIGKNANAMTVESGYMEVANLGTTRRLIVGWSQAFDTTPSWTGTASAPATIGAEISSLTSPTAATPIRRTLPLMGYGI